MFEKCIFFSLNATARELTKLWDHEFKAVGLSASQGYMLILAIKSPGLKQKEIAKSLNLDRSTITRLLDSLEKSGLVRKEAEVEDARGIRVFATAKGRALEDELVEITKNLTKRVCKKIERARVDDYVAETNTILSDLKTV